LLRNEEIGKTFELLENEKIAKESIEIIFESIMAGKSNSVEEAMKKASLETVNDVDLEEIIKEIVEKNEQLVKNQRERSIGPLMGIAMKELRGKASGEIINQLLLKNIQKKL
jgi:glutamyl-tRNA(Gln) amidotransferase subunit E